MTSGCPRRHCWTTWTHRTEGKGVVCWFFMPVQWVLQPWKISDIPVFVFTSGCCGGPEWAERTVFKSKPIRMHFCCIPTPPTLSFLTQSPLPVLMMSLTAVNTVSMETPTTALAYISGSSPSILQPPPPSLTLSPLSLPCCPASSPLAWWEGGTRT